jgi:hypothetical protein
MDVVVDLTKTFMDVVGPDLRDKVDWDRRLGCSGMSSFGSADGTFGDVVSVIENRPIDSMGFTTLLWGYGMLLNDKKTPPEIISRLLPPMTAAFVDQLKSTPIEKQEMSDLVNFMDCYNKARLTGRFDAASVIEIGKVMQQMVHNFSVKCEIERKIRDEKELISGLKDRLKSDITVNRPLKLK